MPQGLRRAVMGLPAIVPIRDHNWNDVKQVEKFGANYNIGTLTDPQDIWSAGGTYTFLAAAATLYASSSDDGDTATINIQGLDANWNLQTVTVDLTGQTQVAISGTWLRVFRVYNADSAVTAGIVYIAEDAGVDITAGKPDTASLIKAQFEVAPQQTLMAIYTVPNGYTAYMFRWYAGLVVGRSSYAIVEMQKRAPGGVFRTTRRIGLASAGTSDYTELLNIAIPFATKTDIKVIVREAGANNMDVSAGFDLLLLADT